MTCHKEWFSYLEKPMQPGVVATGDDTPHPIANVGEVPLSHVRHKGKLMNMLQVPTITKNLVSIGQIVDQGMQCRFTHLGCFIGEERQGIAQGRRDGRMFILDSTDGGTAIGYRLMAQAYRPRQLPKASRPAIETGSVRIAQI